MRVDMACRISMYLTLGLATACLGYAELLFLPPMPFFLIPVGLLLVLAFFFEGRRTIPSWAANVLGLAIAGATVFWVRYVYEQSLAGTDFSGGTIPWPAALLPHVGPLLMLLLLVKLFRPKRAPDFWLLQTIGFLEVALACVLAGETLFGVLLFSYLACGLWSLALFQLSQVQASEDRESRIVDRESLLDPQKSSILDPQFSQRIPWRLLGLAKAGRWGLAATGLGLIIFVAAPRQTDTVWDAGALTSARQLPLESGSSGEMDLNGTGTVKMSDEIAFEVTVTDRENGGGPKLDLPEDQRWRGATLDTYQKGRWHSFMPASIPVELGRIPRGTPMPPQINSRHKHFHQNKELPSLGSKQFFITFDIRPQKAGGVILADPVRLGPGETDHPYKTLKRPGLTYHFQLFFEADGTLNALPQSNQGHYSYVQVAVPPGAAPNEPTPPRWLMDAEFSRFHFHRTPLPQIRGWTKRLLRRLAEQGRHGLTPAHGLDPRSNKLAAQYQEDVARALCNYLASSGEFTYTLDLRRRNKKLDPIVDFLLNVKQGHCERFAAGLALMLRSHGIPTRVVKGYRGAESVGEGRYLVRQRQAHSWVEALVPASEQSGRLCWLTLDPTPADESEEESTFSLARLLDKSLATIELFWKSFLVEFNPDVQRDTFVKLWNYLALAKRLDQIGYWILLLPAAGVLVLLRGRFRRLAHGRDERIPGVAFYAHLLRILARRCRLRPEPAQTPQEFGETARRRLLDLSTPGTLADLPLQVVHLFYQVRFGRLHVPEAECQALDQQLRQLDQALASA